MAFTVKKTRRVAPVRAIFHGPPGIGKSTLAASAPRPIFIAAEDGLDQIDAMAVEPFPTTYEDVVAALDHIATLDFETLVLDSLDWFEPLVWDYTIRKAPAGKTKIKSIEDFGYGKGYIAALDHWRVVLKRLDALRAKGMNIILIAHSVRKMFKNPLGEDYEWWTMKLHEKATGLFLEWAQVVGFCDWDVSLEDSEQRVKAQTTGARIIRTNPDPAYLAKTRFAMPKRLAMPRESPWAAFELAMRSGDEAFIISLKEKLEERIRALGDVEVESKVRAYVKENGATAAVLTDAVERLDITIDERAAAAVAQ